MARGRYVAHTAANGDSLVARQTRARIRTSVSHENVGRAMGPIELHHALLQSAGHAANLFADDVDRGSVGAVLDPLDLRSYYVTQFFRAP
jgi:uncharacterized protein YkwD